MAQGQLNSPNVQEKHTPSRDCISVRMNNSQYDFDDSQSQKSDNAFQGNGIAQSEDGTQNPEHNKVNLTESDSDRHKSDKSLSKTNQQCGKNW